MGGRGDWSSGTKVAALVSGAYNLLGMVKDGKWKRNSYTWGVGTHYASNAASDYCGGQCYVMRWTEILDKRCTPNWAATQFDATRISTLHVLPY